jgi:hypothetical protein
MEQLRLRTDKLRWREIDGEVVAVDIPSSKYLSANGSGAILWQMLATGATLDSLAERLMETFGIDQDRAQGDAKAFVDNLAERDLLER